MIAVRDENGNRATIFGDSLQDAQMIKEYIMRHHPTASNYTINRFAIFKLLFLKE